jgi:hypothetical protein
MSDRNAVMEENGKDHKPEGDSKPQEHAPVAAGEPTKNPKKRRKVNHGTPRCFLVVHVRDAAAPPGEKGPRARTSNERANLGCAFLQLVYIAGDL